MPRILPAVICAFVSLHAFADGPQVLVTGAPRGMGQVNGGAFATDSVTIVNAGPGDASISISQKGSFFSVSPNSFTLAEGQSRTISIRSATQNGGVSDGSISIFTAGVSQSITVPIRLFVGGQPAGIVNPIPSGPVFVEGGANETHRGQIAVTNRGNVGMQGILVADSQWIAPNSSVIGIPSNGQSPGPFAVDPTRRPDGTAPLGTVIGNVALVYLNGTANTSSAESNIAAAPPSSRVNVTVVDTTKPPTGPGQPPPLAPNEIALFLAGLTNRGGIATDLFVSNRATTSIPNLKLYYTPAAASPSSALLADVAQLLPNLNAWFPSAQQRLFGVFNQYGTLQVRNAQVSDVSLTAIESVVPNFVDTLQTVLPVLRSDRGAAKRLFSGVEKTPTRQTNVTLQETSGNAGTVTLDFFDANGATVGPPRTESVQPFGLLSLEDVAPAGAAAMQVTAGGAGKIDGYASVFEQNSFDSWVIADPRGASTSGDDVLIAPIPPLPSTATVDLFVTGPASVNVVGSRRRHAARSHALSNSEVSIAAAAANATQRISLPPSTGGYVRITGTPGAFTASARVTLAKTGVGTYGGAIPVRRAADGAAAGVVRRITGIDDLPNGPHPSLTLIETAGEPADVQVTGRFTFSAGLTANAQVTSSKNFKLAAGQMLTVADIVGTLAGASRSTLGDLRRIVLDVKVTGGGGRVLTFVRSIDSVSGDVTILTE